MLEAVRAEVTVVLADTHPVVRGGMRALLTGAGGIRVTAEAATGRNAVRETVRARPDVLVLDVDTPDLPATIADIRRTAPDTAVLVFTQACDDDSVFAALRAGARGYLLKHAEPSDVVRAVRAVAAGEAVFGSPIAARLTRLLARTRHDPFPTLTPREREVLTLLAAGLPNSAIARRLQVAAKTVSNHLSAILTKLSVPDRAAAIRHARQAGLGRATA